MLRSSWAELKLRHWVHPSSSSSRDKGLNSSWRSIFSWLNSSSLTRSSAVTYIKKYYFIKLQSFIITCIFNPISPILKMQHKWFFLVVLKYCQKLVGTDFKKLLTKTCSRKCFPLLRHSKKMVFQVDRRFLWQHKLRVSFSASGKSTKAGKENGSTTTKK